MKKITMICLGLTALLLTATAFLPVRAETAQRGISLSSNALTVKVGETKTFTITAFDTIADVAISSNNTNVAQVDHATWTTDAVGANETKTDTITVTGVSAGQATITVAFIDAVIFETEEDLSGQNRTLNVQVTDSASETPGGNTGGNSGTGTGGNRPDNSNPSDDNPGSNNGNTGSIDPPVDNDDNHHNNQANINNNQVANNNVNRPATSGPTPNEATSAEDDKADEDSANSDPDSSASQQPDSDHDSNSSSNQKPESEVKPAKANDPPIALIITGVVALVAAAIGGGVYFYRKQH